MKNKFYSITASVIGQSHIYCEKPNQDNIYFKSNDDFICISVADGLGSCSKSDIGSSIATKTSVEYIIENIKKDSDIETLLRTAVENSIKAIQLQAIESEIVLKEYATTLIVVVIDKMKKVYMIQTGDGGVVVFSENTASLVSEVTKMEAKNIVVPITSPMYKDYTTYSEFDGDYQALAIFTDGIESFSVRENEDARFQPIESFWRSMYGAIKECDDETKWSEDLAHYLANNEPIKRHSSDDKTIGIIIFKDKK
jgi:hypothetical protein